MLSNRAFDCELVSGEAADILHADASEIETIHLMTGDIARMPQITSPEIRKWLSKPSSITRLRNFASFVAREETFTVEYEMQGDIQSLVAQKVLSISKSRRAKQQHLGGTWTDFVEEAMKICCHNQA